MVYLEPLKQKMKDYYLPEAGEVPSDQWEDLGSHGPAQPPVEGSHLLDVAKIIIFWPLLIPMVALDIMDGSWRK